MSTNSRIGIYNSKTNTTRSIYVHWDGNPKDRIPLLNTHFKNRTKINKLIDLGDLSALYPKITKPKNHSFDTPVNGYTIAYGRDRDETNVKPITNIGKKMSTLEACNYLYIKSKWYYRIKGVWVDVSDYKEGEDISLRLEK